MQASCRLAMPRNRPILTEVAAESLRTNDHALVEDGELFSTLAGAC